MKMGLEALKAVGNLFLFFLYTLNANFSFE
jgi:hypothetical protein